MLALETFFHLQLISVQFFIFSLREHYLMAFLPNLLDQPGWRDKGFMTGQHVKNKGNNKSVELEATALRCLQ